LTVEITEGTELTVSQEQRRNEDERRAVRLVGAHSASTAAFGGQSNRRFVAFMVFVSFVVRTPFVFVASILL